MQEHPNHTLGWELDRDAQDNTIGAAALLPGQTLTGLSAVRATKNPGYLNAKFAILTLGIYTVPGTGRMKQSTGFVQKQDIVPPTLSVTLAPSTMRSGSRLLSVAATITANDNYDPLPAIVLESITANQALKSGDVSGAAFGTDDRAFKLKPVKGRIYTVTYSATDGSGNKSTASATVTVGR